MNRAPLTGDAARLPTLSQLLARVQLRVTLFAVGLTGLTVLFAGFATIGRYAERNVELVAASAAYGAAPAIVFDDAAAAHQAIAQLMRPGVASIAVLRANGTQLAVEHHASEDGDSLARFVADRLFFDTPVDAPILHLGKRIGTVRVVGEGSAIAVYIRAGFLGTIACLLITGLATFLLGRRLRAQIVEPLAAVAAAAHSFRREETFEARLPPAAIREVEALRADFDALIGELADWRQHMRREHESLSHQALHDPLTGLPNRSLFERSAAEFLADARVSGAPFALLYADADAFKPINDHHGHAAGDAVLVETAARLRACLRARDIAARLGGDEFVLMLAAPSGAEAAERVRTEIAARMADPIDLPGGGQTVLNLSIGIALYPQHGFTLETLTAHADAAMYASKGRQIAGQEGGK